MAFRVRPPPTLCARGTELEEHVRNVERFARLAMAWRRYARCALNGKEAFIPHFTWHRRRHRENRGFQHDAYRVGQRIALQDLMRRIATPRDFLQCAPVNVGLST